MDDSACQTPMADHIARAIDLMQRGARMRLDAIPGDSSMSSSMFGPDVTAEIAKRLTAPEAKSEVEVKALSWKGPDSSGEHHSIGGLWNYIVRAQNGNGVWLTEVGDYFLNIEAAKAAAQSDYETRIRSALVDPEGGV